IKNRLIDRLISRPAAVLSCWAAPTEREAAESRSIAKAVPMGACRGRPPSCVDQLPSMQPRTYPVLTLYAALLPLPWMFSWEPLENVISEEPNVHAHLSEFSLPCWSYQAFSCGSVSISLSSWPLTLASAFRPWLCGALLPGSQPGSPSRLKKKPNCTS